MARYYIMLAFLCGTVFVLADAAWLIMMEGGLL